MLSVWIILAAIIILSLSGLPGCLFSARGKTGQIIAMLLMAVGSILGLTGVALAFGTAVPVELRMPWFLPCGQFAVSIDALSIIFLIPVFVVPALGSVYGLGYWKPAEHPENGRRLSLFYGLLAGSMALVAIADDGVLFLIAWEIMALAAYFAATVEDDKPEVSKSGWIYLIATHIGTLFLIAMFALWRSETGSFILNPVQMMQPEVAGTIFVLALIGFGFKAGLMPLHVWLPGAHANAPSHVSAVMSGVMLKMGIYGIVRMTALLPVPAAWWGGVLLTVGVITGVAGIAFAIGQHDLKRLLAYSSIENIGIIAMGLGLALLGRCYGKTDWVLLGLGGALLHVWNHSLFKSLLFFNAGAIIHAVHTRDIDRLGGLGKSMPKVMALFIVGAVAICALPPLNGFAGEWLLYLGLFKTLGIGGESGVPIAALAVVALSMIGALAVACFIKLTGAVFLGSQRDETCGHGHEPPASMFIPMAVLAAGCFCIGLFPVVVTQFLENAAKAWSPNSEVAVSIAQIAPLQWITVAGLCIVGLVILGFLILKILLRKKIANGVGTWDCGYARPTARMQYTGSSFVQTIVSLFAFILWPKTRQPSIHGIFSKTTYFKSIVPDFVLDRLALPVFSLLGGMFSQIRILQQGRTNLYLFYILIIVLVLLIFGGNL